MYINDYLCFVSTWNKGISFGILSQSNANLVLGIVISILIMGLIIWMISLPRLLSQIFLSLAIAGAIGNLYDRYFFGGVFDFICVHYQDYYFPVFNLADCFISIGMVLLILYMHRSDIKK